MRLYALAAFLSAALSTAAHAQPSARCSNFAGKWHNSKDVVIDVTIKPDCSFSYTATYGLLQAAGTGDIYFDPVEGIVLPFHVLGGGDTDRFMLRHEHGVLTGKVRAYSIPRGVTLIPAD